MPDILYCLLAGGRGERLMPLTSNRPKPLVRFGASGRIIDFTLYNCQASMGGDCLVLTQYLSDILDNFLRVNWKGSYEAIGRRLEIMPSDKSPLGRYMGTSNAVWQVLSRRERLPRYTVVLAADHVYKMNYNPMIEFHQAHGGAVTVGAVECERDESHRFGIVKVREDGKIESFHEKPQSLDAVVPPDKNPLASMGIYVFTTRFLLDCLDENRSESSHDFGKDIMPRLARQGEAWAFSCKNENGGQVYWRDIGELRAYMETSMEVLNGHGQELNFDNLSGLKRIPFSQEQIVRDYVNGHQRIKNSMISSSARIAGAVIEDSIIGPDVRIEEGAVVLKSVLMDGALVKKHVELDNALVEPYVGIGTGWFSRPDIIWGLHFPFGARA